MDPKLPGQRVRELIAPLGFVGGKTIVDDYLREIRPLFDPPRTYQRTVYRPGEICQFDLWEPSFELPVGHGQTRRGWSSSLAWGTRAPAQGPWSSPSRRRICCLAFAVVCGRWARCLRRWSGIASRGCMPPAAGRPTGEFASFCGQVKVDWHFCQPRDPPAKGVVQRLQDFMM